MKQIDIIRTYSQKRCLVVDDVPDVRASLKRTLVDFGSSNVDTAGNAEEAIDLCRRNQYDIVLSDYNLGAGKNGQQLLEELRFHGLLYNTSLYIMITAENASQYVLHTLEYQPDDYMSKPINRESLRPRLDQALLKNEALLGAKKALDQKQPLRAIAACSKLLARKNRYANDARKMLGELLIAENRFEEALAVYDQIPSERQPIWCRIGIARALFGRLEYEQAQSLLESLLEENALCLEAHDLLARIHEAANQHGRAQQMLASALHISPRSTERQREMGRVSHIAEDELAAVHAYRAAVKHSRHTCQERADDYLYLARGLASLAREDMEPGPLIQEATETLKVVEKRFGQNPVVIMRCRLLEAELQQILEDHEAAQQSTAAALDVQANMNYSVLQHTPVQLSIDCARAFMARGEYDAGELLLQEIARINKDPLVAVQLDKLLREPLTREGTQLAARLNKQGILYYQAQKYDEAIASFEDVLRELPNHIGLNLNLVQAIISKNKGAEISDSECGVIASCLQRIGKIAPGSGYAERYEYLIRQYERLIELTVK